MTENKKTINQYEYPNFIDCALAIHGSVSPRVWKKVFAAFMYACLISLLSIFIPSLSLPISPFEYAGVIMGLILVFRVNAGYDRWWEARKLWGTVVNCSRNLAIIFINYSRNSNRDEIDNGLGLIAAMPYLMKNQLRGVTKTDEIQHLVDKDTYVQLQRWQHQPNFISSKFAELLSQMQEDGKLNQFSFLKAEEIREMILDCQGACERILKTPMPFVMAIKSRRFILLFLLILPIALVNYSVYINPIIVTLVAYALFSLDQIGVELQNPFSIDNLSHLPLNDICKTIENNVIELKKSKITNETIGHVLGDD
ncbi:bestrophin family protein [Legionella quateirensis]|uniref:Bestrophin, RFP-TM, chloride channel n=1 Tax=Legionella quateirensis TaxID=45072 RepID=A0A378KP78_9GAMM|nr:bestrophin family ion channel [Legionella quateirensis]KTD52887.1 Bestrophin, RFP-TM, chloride channel [Legionella quateirensis]STY16383.1 Predicted membrane protein [Legionella quateirensis]